MHGLGISFKQMKPYLCSSKTAMGLYQALREALLERETNTDDFDPTRSDQNRVWFQGKELDYMPSGDDVAKWFLKTYEDVKHYHEKNGLRKLSKNSSCGIGMVLYPEVEYFDYLPPRLQDQYREDMKKGATLWLGHEPDLIVEHHDEGGIHWHIFDRCLTNDGNDYHFKELTSKPNTHNLHQLIVNYMNQKDTVMLKHPMEITRNGKTKIKYADVECPMPKHKASRNWDVKEHKTSNKNKTQSGLDATERNRQLEEIKEQERQLQELRNLVIDEKEQIAQIRKAKQHAIELEEEAERKSSIIEAMNEYRIDSFKEEQELMREINNNEAAKNEYYAQQIENLQTAAEEIIEQEEQRLSKWEEKANAFTAWMISTYTGEKVAPDDPELTTKFWNAVETEKQREDKVMEKENYITNNLGKVREEKANFISTVTGKKCNPRAKNLDTIFTNAVTQTKKLTTDYAHSLQLMNAQAAQYTNALGVNTNENDSQLYEKLRRARTTMEEETLPKIEQIRKANSAIENVTETMGAISRAYDEDAPVFRVGNDWVELFSICKEFGVDIIATIKSNPDIAMMGNAVDELLDATQKLASDRDTEEYTKQKTEQETIPTYEEYEQAIEVLRAEVKYLEDDTNKEDEMTF